MAPDEERDGYFMTNGNSAERVPLLHKVKVPPKRDVFAEIGSGLYELFFHDAPLDQFKGQSHRKKGLLGLKFVFPILNWIISYTPRMLLADTIPGCTIASLAIPKDLGCARLAGVPPANGLYSSFVPTFGYSAFGSSRDIAIDPVSGVSLLLGTLLKQEISPTDNPEDYLQLAFTATFYSGVFQAGLEVFRLGFVTEFLSHAAVVGFMAGAVITIALQQLKGLLNITHFTTETDFISVMKSVFGHIDQGQKEKLFWISAIAPVTSVILSTLFVFLTRVDQHGVKIVGHIKKGINPVSADQFFLSGSLAAAGAKIGLIASLTALAEGVDMERTFAALRDYHIDGNEEMIAFGVMNLCSSVTSCYIATGSFSRSAVNYQAGVYTAMSNVIMSVMVLITLLVLTLLFKYTPNTILSAIIISAVLSLIDLWAAWLIWKIDKFDFLACLGAFVGVFFVSVEIGLLIALAFANPGALVISKLDDSKFFAHLGSEWLFFTASEAIQVVEPSRS